MVRSESRAAQELWPAFAAVLLALLLPCASYDFWLPDEPRVAHTAYEMGRSSSYLLPEVNDEAFLQIPPLHSWLLRGWFAVSGDSDATARYLSALLSLGTVLCLISLARTYGGTHLGVVSAAVLVSTVQFWDVGHRVVVETSLTCFLTVAFTCLAHGLLLGGAPLRWCVAAGVALGAAFLVKGLAAPVYVGVVCGAFFCLQGERPRGRVVFGLFLLMVSAVLVAAPWALAFYREYPAEFRELTVDHVLRRVVEGGVKNPPLFDFVHRTAGNLLPWAVALPFVLLAHLRCVRGAVCEGLAPRAGSARGWSLFLLLWALVPIVLLTFSRSKRQLYLLPVFPPFALLTAVWLETAISRLRPRTVSALLWGVFLAAGGGVVVAAERSFASDRSPAWALYAIVGLLLFMGLQWLPRRRWRAAGTGTERLAALLALAVAVWGTTYHLVRSPEKSVAAFCNELRQRELDGYTVVGYRLSEREVGAVAWYLRRPIPLWEGTLDGVRGAYDRPLLVGDAADLDGLIGRPVGPGEVLAEKKLRRRTLLGVHPLTVGRGSSGE